MAYFFNPKYINEQVLSLMETKGLKWKKPWIEKVGGGLPMNAVTGKPYHGMNVLLLMGSWNSGGTYWATLKQWGSIGVRVREDQIKKGTAICFYTSKRLVMEGDDGQEKTSYQPVIKTFLVYSSRQIEGGWEEPAQPKKLYETQGSTLVQGMVTSLMVDLRHGGNRAYYMPSGDFVQMPDKDQFLSDMHYDGTLLHEVGHWTGHNSRGLREVPWAWFGTPDYAREELVAELISVYLSVTLGIEIEAREDHAAYLQSWMQVIKDDRWAFYRAAKKAERAVNWIVKKCGLEVETIPVEEAEAEEAGA